MTEESRFLVKGGVGTPMVGVTIPVELHKWPKTVGYWVIGGLYKVAQRQKVTDEQIRNTEELLGWKWEDA